MVGTAPEGRKEAGRMKKSSSASDEPEDEAARIRSVAARLWLGKSADPDIQIDADAEVAIAEDRSGAWVQAWLWVDFEHFAEESA